MNQMLTPVLKLRLSGLGSQFDAAHLEDRASSLVHDIKTLFNTDELLLHSKMVHKFTLILDDHERPAIQLVVGLGLNNQMQLDYHHHSVSAADLELKILEDRERLVKACLSLPIQTTLAANEISRVVTAG